MPQATDSQMAMWRGAIALAWASGTLDQGIKERLLAYFRDNVFLSPEQRAQLAGNLEQKILLKDVWAGITNTEDRAYLIDIAHSLFATHGGANEAEKAAYDKMLADQMATVDTKALQDDVLAIKARIPAEMANYEAEYQSDFSNMGFIGRIIYRINKLFGGGPI
jgi:hypothetical protein